MSAQHMPGLSYGQIVRKTGGTWKGDTITFTPDALVRFSAMVNTGRTAVEAAAPELLAALKALHANMQAQDLDNDAERPTEEEFQECMRNAATAIAKATGGTA